MPEIYLRLDELAKTVKVSLDRYMPIYSHVNGIINATLERTYFQRYGLYLYQCISGKIQELGSFSREPSSGGLGVADNREEALLACFGEAIERYCMSWVDEGKITTAKWCDLPDKYRPSVLKHYTDEQYVDNPEYVDPKCVTLEWVLTKKLASNMGAMYWPASLIYIPYERGARIAEVTSTGVASHVNIQQAYQSGVLEIIERDAIILNHVKQLYPPHIELNTISGKARKLIERLREEYDIRVYELYTDTGVPTYLSYIWQDKDANGDFHFGIGGASGLLSEQAVYKSLLECVFTFRYGYNMMKDRQADKDKICTLYEHFLYYQDRGRFHDELLTARKCIAFTHKELTFDDVMKKIEQIGYSVYAYDLTSPDILPIGIHVVRTIIPGFMDMNAKHSLIRKASDRFNMFSKNTGVTSGVDGYNPEPHPMP
jgi:ribosomal protein S12 methylthiotransferase accessory factor